MAKMKSVETVIDSIITNLSYNSATGKYEAALTAPSVSSFNLEGGYYNVKVLAKDEAGNSTLVSSITETIGESLKLYVKEEVKPVIYINRPSKNARLTNADLNIDFEVRDNVGHSEGYSGIDRSSLAIYINGRKFDRPNVTWTEISGGYRGTCRLDILPDGNNNIAIDISDNDGNAANQASVSFIVDTIAPSLNVISPADDLMTNKSELTVSGTTDDATSKPVSVVISLNGTNVGDVDVDNTDGSFSKTLTLSDGENTIIVTATDKAGKKTSITRTVTLDTDKPVIKSVIIRANGAAVSASNRALAGKTYTIEVEVE